MNVLYVLRKKRGNRWFNWALGLPKTFQSGCLCVRRIAVDSASVSPGPSVSWELSLGDGEDIWDDPRQQRNAASHMGQPSTRIATPPFWFCGDADVFGRDHSLYGASSLWPSWPWQVGYIPTFIQSAASVSQHLCRPNVKITKITIELYH